MILLYAFLATRIANTVEWSNQTINPVSMGVLRLIRLVHMIVGLVVGLAGVFAAP